ncbi:MAG: hypothetical protein ABIK99_03765 [candidate division WOR-3 bacterium]
MKEIGDISPEKIWRVFENRYEVIIRCSHLLRKLLEEQREGRFSPPEGENIFVYALKRILAEGKNEKATGERKSK